MTRYEVDDIYRCGGGGKKKEECIIALKVYDQCRQQDCIRAIAEIDQQCLTNAQVAEIDNFRLCEVSIDKKKNFLDKNYYDLTITYTFVYDIIIDNCQRYEDLTTIYTKNITLFGSDTEEVFIATDMCDFHHDCGGHTMPVNPFALVEAKAIPLSAKIIKKCHGKRVGITIGLFTIIKLFRLVNLLVDSKGFCMPNECEEISQDPCDYFDNLDFPFDIFNPKQKEDVAGIKGMSHHKKCRDCEDSFEEE